MEIKKLSQKEIIELIEGDGKIMDFRIKYDNLPVWPLIRDHVFDAVMTYVSEGYYKTKERYSIGKTIKDKMTRLVFLTKICIKSKIFNRGKLKKRTVLLFPNRNYLRDGKVHENIFGHYIIDEDSTLIVKYYDDKYRWYGAEADTIFREGFHSMSYIVDDLIGKRKNNIDKENGKNIAKFISERIGINDKNVDKFIKNRVENLSNIVSQRERVIDDICKKTMPKYVIMSEAVYSYFAVECHYFRKKGIPVFEIEHGMIDENHSSYFFSERIYSDKEYEMFLPNMLVVWSDHIRNCVHVNAKVKVLGNPEFYYSLEHDYMQSRNNRKDTHVSKFLLNVYEQVEAEKIVTDFLSQNNTNMVLVLRFHPLYRNLELFFEKYSQYNNILIDKSDGIYNAFGSCDFLISDFSTIAIEALACGMRVFTNKIESYQDENVSYDVEEFKNVKELFDMVSKEKKPNICYDYKNMFFGKDIKAVDLYRLYEQSE